MFEDFARSVEWERAETIEIHAIFKTHAFRGDDFMAHVAPEKKCFFIYTFDGQAEATVCGETFTLTPSTVIIINSQHRAHFHVAAEKWSRWFVVIQMENHLLPLHEVLSVVLDKDDLQLLALALAAMKRGNPPLSAAYFTGVYYSTLEKVRRQQLSKNQQLIQDAVLYMRENISSFSIPDLCEELLISERTLRKIFAQELHISPKKYYQFIRLEDGRSILERNDWSIETTATMLGFSSPGHFSTAFKKQYGISPQAYREGFKY